MEIWKPLRNFPSYNGSSEGRIMNIRTQKILKPTVDKNGSVKVSLQKNNRQYTVKVHRLIADTFLDDCTGLDVRHKDNDPLNNRVNNLEICTRSELIRNAYARGTKKPYQNCRIRVMETAQVYDSITECAREIGCDRTHITKYFSGKCSHVKGLHFVREINHA